VLFVAVLLIVVLSSLGLVGSVSLCPLLVFIIKKSLSFSVGIVSLLFGCF
jgi:hypothetical protein